MIPMLPLRPYERPGYELKGNGWRNSIGTHFLDKFQFTYSPQVVTVFAVQILGLGVDRCVATELHKLDNCQFSSRLYEPCTNTILGDHWLIMDPLCHFPYTPEKLTSDGFADVEVGCPQLNMTILSPSNQTFPSQRQAQQRSLKMVDDRLV